jgi:hypothetical protein
VYDFAVMESVKGEAHFLERVIEYLVSLPFDLKILQEAISDPDLDRKERQVLAGTVIHALSPKEGSDLLRYVEDALLVRAGLSRVVKDGSEGGQAFRARFADVYDQLEGDLKLFEQVLGDLWPWLEGKLDGFARLQHRGKTTSQYVDDEEAASFLYEENEVFQTNYTVSEEQAKNRVRRLDQVLEVLHKRRADDLKKKV